MRQAPALALNLLCVGLVRASHCMHLLRSFSQAISERTSSSAFGFGTSTREEMMKTYMSPAHLKDMYGKFSPSPDKYTLQSSLGRQVLDSKCSYPSRSFGLEERFDADRRDQRAAQTPGPGAYRT